MAISYNTFDVTVSDITGRVHSIKVSTATSPSLADVQSMIIHAASDIAGEAFSSGVVVSNVTDSSAEYYILRNAVIYKVCGDLMVARDRGGEAFAASFYKQYDRCMTMLRRRPQVVANTTTGPNLAKSVFQASENELSTYSNGIAGKIVNGGF